MIPTPDRYELGKMLEAFDYYLICEKISMGLVEVKMRRPRMNARSQFRYWSDRFRAIFRPGRGL